MIYSIARHFSKFPAGVTRADGPFSGQALREDLLAALKVADQMGEETLWVDLNGTMGYGSSFLKAAFGGLGHAFAGPGASVKSIQLVSEDTSLVREVWEYIPMSEEKCFSKGEAPADHIREANAYLDEVEMLKPGGVGHAAGLHKAVIELVAYLVERDAIEGIKPSVFTQQGPTIKQLQDLWRACCAWRDQLKPRVAESVYQVDRINAETPMLAEAVLEVVGYWKDPEDG
jgi:hypothetical protein